MPDAHDGLKGVITTILCATPAFVEQGRAPLLRSLHAPCHDTCQQDPAPHEAAMVGGTLALFGSCVRDA